jgi:hypothetical protein
MRPHVHPGTIDTNASTIPLLDASSLPSDDDWTLLESIKAWPGIDFEPDADRFGRFNVSAAYDE